MDAAVAGLLGTGIGAFAGLMGSILTGRQQDRAERERRRDARLDELLKAERQALLHLTELVATGTQAILWLAWAAEVKPNAEVRREIETYETRMRELAPQLLAADAAAAGLSNEAFERLDPLVNELISLDTKVGTYAAGFGKDADEARRRLAAIKQDAVSISYRTIDGVRALLRDLEH